MLRHYETLCAEVEDVQIMADAIKCLSKMSPKALDQPAHPFKHIHPIKHILLGLQFRASASRAHFDCVDHNFACHFRLKL